MCGVWTTGSTLRSGAAGLRAVQAPGVENVDVARVLKEHWELPRRMPELLGILGVV